MQYIETPLWLVIIAQLSWQFSHGTSGISYIFLNPTMRKELLRVFGGKTKTLQTHNLASIQNNSKNAARSLGNSSGVPC